MWLCLLKFASKTKQYHKCHVVAFGHVPKASTVPLSDSQSWTCLLDWMHDIFGTNGARANRWDVFMAKLPNMDQRSLDRLFVFQLDKPYPYSERFCFVMGQPAIQLGPYWSQKLNLARTWMGDHLGILYPTDNLLLLVRGHLSDHQSLVVILTGSWPYPNTAL